MFEFNITLYPISIVFFVSWCYNYLQVILQDEKSLMESLNKNTESGWMQPHATQNGNDVDAAPEPLSDGSSASVRELVTSLLECWQQEHPHYMVHIKKDTGIGNSSGGLSKAEQQFLQRISDLVTYAHER